MIFISKKVAKMVDFYHFILYNMGKEMKNGKKNLSVFIRLEDF